MSIADGDGRARQQHQSPSTTYSAHQRFKASSTPIFLFIFLLWALWLTFPLILTPFRTIPLGSESAGTVPLFNLWVLQWNIDQLMQGYPNYWDAPVFSPTKGTFAFSETQPLTAFLATPLWLGLQSPTFGYNFAVLLFLTLNGWFAFCLLKVWGASNLVAIFAGLIMQSLPFIAQEMGVLQLVAIFGYLWTLFFLDRFLAQIRQGGPNKRNTVGLALGLPVTLFTCGYYGLFSLLFLPILLLTQIQRQQLKLTLLKQLTIVATLSLALTAPFLWAQHKTLSNHGFTRSEKVIATNSAQPDNYVQFLDYNVLYGQMFAVESDSPQRLFPGFMLVLLAGIGLYGQRRSRVKVYLVTVAIFALLLSMGLNLQIGTTQPYQWLRDYYPGFAQLRSPYRFAVLVQIHLALLAGFGLLNFERWAKNGGRVAGAVCTGIILLEALALPMPLQAVPVAQSNMPWQSWLNQQNQTPTLVMVPFAASSRAADYEQTVRWMLEGREFEAQMLNGYSGFFPEYHANLRQQMQSFPSRHSIDLLQKMDVDYVIVRHGLDNAPSTENVDAFLSSVFFDTQGNVSIYIVGQ